MKIINYKTTIIGLLGAVWLVLQPIITKGDFEFERDWKQLLTAAIVACFGFFAKDHNVTGGNKENVPNDASVVKETTKTDKS